MGAITKIFAFIYILIGLYLVNFYLKLVSLEFLISIEGWIMLIAGIIILIHGIKFLFKRAKKTFDNF